MSRPSFKRALVELEADGKSEWVEVIPGQEGAVYRSTRGSAEVPEVWRAAIQEQLTARASDVITDRASEAALGTAPASVSSEGPGPYEAPTAEGQEFQNLADALDDLRTAILRAGVRKGITAPGFVEAYERLLQLLGDPVPWGAKAFLQGVRRAMSEGDIPTLALRFASVETVAAYCRSLGNGQEKSSQPADENLLFRAGWSRRNLRSHDVTRVSDRRLIELARTWVPGLQGVREESRYLMCVQRGAIYREIPQAGGTRLSEGPCPRTVHVGLAELEQVLGPERISLLQYKVESHWPRSIRRRIARHSISHWSGLADRYREQLALGSELPLVLSATRFEADGSGAELIDREGQGLALLGESVVEALESFSRRHPAQMWVFGLLGHRGAQVAFKPLSAFADDEQDGRYILL